MIRQPLLFFVTALLACLAAHADESENHAAVLAYLEPLKSTSEEIASFMWKNPELGFHEYRASRELSEFLEQSGFRVEKGVAGMPTAFVASFGRGKPVIAILGEMDALPGESQAVAPRREILPGKVGSHACGHNLFGAGSAAAAVAAGKWLKESGRSGTLRYYAAPAEEGGAGKVYMVREGLFDDVDVALHWHPGGVNAAIPVTNSAMMSGKFRFRGTASHAATSPERGRSALDGVEVMDYIVNTMREHIPSTARIHYVITSGGDAPNIVPEYAEVYYYARERDVADLKSLWARIEKAARGAAMATETEVEIEVIHGTYNNLVSHSLERALDANLRKRADALIWTDGEREFAREIYDTFTRPWMAFSTETQVVPFQEMHIPGSSDVGDISWIVPTGGFIAAAWVPSTDPHTWQATAVGDNGIGFKGMHLASEVLAMTAVDLFTSPDLMAAAKKEFEERRGDGFVYEPLVGDRAPPLDYRAAETERTGR
jgi:aminobenzoyl-glutamate utilization protein B